MTRRLVIRFLTTQNCRPAAWRTDGTKVYGAKVTGGKVTGAKVTGAKVAGAKVADVSPEIHRY